VRRRWLLAVAAATLFAESGARADARAPVHLRLAEPSRAALLADGALVVRLRNRARVRVSARLGRAVLVRSRVLRPRRRARAVTLRLTAAGRAALEACSSRRLTVKARGRGRSAVVARALACETAPGFLPTAPALCPACGTLPLPHSPSGAPMPVGDLPGWRQVFTDDFTGSAIDARKWGRYQGQPAGDPGGWWEPSHVEVGGGVVALRTYRDPRHGNRWVSGGMSSARGLTQRYGRYDVRFRMDSGYGIASVLLLWPTADHWPPEIDFAEHGGKSTARDRMTATLHYGEDDQIVQRTVHADFTRWHTMGVEWTPGRLVYTLDGRPWATVEHPGVPAETMELDAQTQAGTEGDFWNPAPDASTPAEVDMEIDWAVAYAPAG
jgi:hypothetical protein